MSEKKSKQLGVNYSTASHRLIKDIMYDLLVRLGKNKCFHCGKDMTRGTYSVEHKTAWLDSHNPIELFFDLDNISFSHLSCNISRARKLKVPHSDETLKDMQKKYKQNYLSKLTKEEKSKTRREKYLRTGT